jgi:hypothetical protein
MCTVRKFLKISAIKVGIQEFIIVFLQMISKKQKADVKVHFLENLSDNQRSLSQRWAKQKDFL